MHRVPHERARRESWVFPLVLVCFVAILGIIAFVIQLQGMRRQYELLERQRVNARVRAENEDALRAALTR